MRQNDLIKEACKQVPPSEVDAFVKGARWILDSINDDNVRVVLEDQLPYGSIVLERFPNGSPKVVLGPNLGELSQSNARKVANKGLWELPSEERLEQLYDHHTEVFEFLYKNGEKSIMTNSTGKNGSWINQKVFDCKEGTSSQTIPGNAPYPTRALLDLGKKE